MGKLLKKTETKSSSASSSDKRERRVLKLYEQLVEIEERLIPTGLHVFGRVAGERSQADMLRMVASFDREEKGARALTDLVSEGFGLGDYQSLLAASFNNGEALKSRERVESIVRKSISLFLESGIDAAIAYLEDSAHVRAQDSRLMFDRIENIAQQLKTNGELEALARALRGEYIEPGPGADIVQNPDILPTGRNTHAVNPYMIPSEIAFTRAEHVVKHLLERHLAEKGSYPRAMALVLWGLDNIKTQGEGVAQALWLLGVRPVRDQLNRATEVEPIPLEILKRPRIDVVMTLSGIFRDLFGATMNLLDKAVRLVASLDEPPEMNFLRKNVLRQVEEENFSFDEAALRLFSNAPGNYGTNVNFMVMDSQWDSGETLGDLFVTRKCFAYGRDPSGRMIEGREARSAMERALSRVEAAHQNIDSFEIGITDVDHYFEYLGGVAKAVEKRANSKPAIYLSDSLSRETKVRSLEETVRLETRTKTLNPKWYEGMLAHGFRGVEIGRAHV